MGSVHLVFLSPSTLCYLAVNPSITAINPSLSSEFRCSLSSRPRWDPNPYSFRGGRFEFDEEFGFQSRVRENRGNWWSDDDDDDDEFEFEFWEEPSVIDWIFKILGAFGWIIPAVAISTLLGTSTNSLIMAVVLPLGQSALSLAMDKLWGDSTSSPKSRSRSRSRTRSRPKRNPFSGSTVGSQKKKRGARGPESSGNSAKRSGTNGSKYGGWDELDDESSNGVGQDPRAEGFGTEQTGSGKLSRTRRGEKPLFVRLLIAVFPFLDSWTRFL